MFFLLNIILLSVILIIINLLSASELKPTTFLRIKSLALVVALHWGCRQQSRASVIKLFYGRNLRVFVIN
jgi:hypothetical protein